MQGPEQAAPRFELVLSDEQDTETLSDTKEKKNQRRRKRRRELKQQRLREAFALATPTSRTPTVSASSQEDLVTPDEDSEQDVTMLPQSKVRRTAGVSEQTPAPQEEAEECEVQAHMPSMNRETYRRLPADKSIISLISNRRVVHKFFLCDEKWAFDCAKHLDNAKAELSRRAELIIQRTTSTSMMYDPVFTSMDKFWKLMKNNAHLLRIVGKLFTYADLTNQFKAEPWTIDDFRKYRNLNVENPFYLTKDQQSYLAEVMGLDYVYRWTLSVSKSLQDALYLYLNIRDYSVEQEKKAAQIWLNSPSPSPQGSA